jgi:glutathione synthase/RimK-type ligase-like ATP-grasp enzyme
LNYNFEKPNRTVPYKLSSELMEKLTLLMNDLHMESGSIDIVVTKDKRFVFLEVNPVGQFAQVTGPCNYNLYKVIAEYLTKKRN